MKQPYKVTFVALHALFSHVFFVRGYVQNRNQLLSLQTCCFGHFLASFLILICLYFFYVWSLEVYSFDLWLFFSSQIMRMGTSVVYKQISSTQFAMVQCHASKHTHTYLRTETERNNTFDYCRSQI